MARNGTVGDNLALEMALASGASVADAARQGGMAVRTVYRWLAQPEFRHRIARLQQSITRRAAGRISDGMSEAADVLRELLKCEDHDVRLRAARALFEFGARLRDSVELEARLVDLEQERLKEGAPTS
jgi:transposase-like protein